MYAASWLPVDYRPAMRAVPRPKLCAHLFLTLVVGVIAWRCADASRCVMPPPTTVLQQARKQPQLQEQLRYLTDAFPPQAHTIATRDNDRTDQWLGLQWDAPPLGALFLLDCEGNVLDASGVGAVETIQKGPTLPGAGRTVLVTAITTTGTGYKLEEVGLFGAEGGKLHLLWNHTQDEHIFVLPKEDGEEDVYGWRFEQDGTVIHVYGSRTIFPPPMKGHSGDATPLSVKSQPTERYCWWPHQARFEPCNLVAPPPAVNARLEVIPFVGCPIDEQGNPQAAPTGQPLHVAVAPELARKLAYYKGAQRWGAFAPQGWHCYGWYGSGGGFLMVTPGEIQASDTPQNVPGTAVVASSSDGETSGRETAVAVAKRFFSQPMQSYIQRVESYDQSINWPPITAEPVAPDTVRRVTDRIVEFVTPANQDGYGTWEKIMTPSSRPIRGIISISSPDEDVGLVEILVRLPATDDALASAILRVEESCLQKENSCSADED
jgi:hypothetical protein